MRVGVGLERVQRRSHGALGRVEKSNGKFRAGNISSSGALLGSGWVRSIGTYQNSGRIGVGLNEHLILDAALDNSAYVEINGDYRS